VWPNNHIINSEAPQGIHVGCMHLACTPEHRVHAAAGNVLPHSHSRRMAYFSVLVCIFIFHFLSIFPAHPQNLFFSYLTKLHG